MKLINNLYNNQPFNIEKDTATKPFEYIYVIYNPISKLTKIGITTNLQQRLSSISTMNGIRIEIICTGTVFAEIDQSAIYIERFLHYTFKEFRMIGEWFNLSDLQHTKIQTFLNTITE